MRRGKFKRVLSTVLAMVTFTTSVMSPFPAFAADQEPPSYEAVKDQLDDGEIVKGEDITIEFGADFDISDSLKGIDIKNPNMVKVTFHEAKNSDGDRFSVKKAGTYKATYHVQPKNTEHPKYQISRKITVKEAPQEEKVEVKTMSESTDRGGDSGKTEEASDKGESDTESETKTEKVAEESEKATTEEKTAKEEADNKEIRKEESVETESSEAKTEASESKENTEESVEEVMDNKAFDDEIASTQDQETVDPESGLSLADVMKEAEEEDIDLLALEPNETISINLMSSLEGTKSVDITRGTCYHYDDYGLGSFLTYKYTVKFGGITATAYCVQPSKKSPDDGKFTITKLKDSKALAKVCYYGTKASGDEGFFAEKHPGFSEGKKFIITHLAAAYANGSGDAFSGANSTGKSLAMELYNYCMDQPDIPDVDMEFTDDNVKAYVDGTIQRTKLIKFVADELQTITFKLPAGVQLHNETNGKTSKAGASVEISGGTKFYLSAPLNYTETHSKTWSTTMKGSITKDYSAYKISTGSTQDLGLVFGEGVDDEKYIDFKVTWMSEAYVQVIKKDKETGYGIAGAVYGLYRDAACTSLITAMPATDENGASKVTIEKTQDTVYLKEISVPTGYLIDTASYNVGLVVGSTTTSNVQETRVKATIHIIKEDKETGRNAQGDATFAGAEYGLYAKTDIIHPDGHTGVVHHANDKVATITLDKNGDGKVENLYLGSYYVKEITAPVGYLIDENSYDVVCSYEGANVAVVERTAISKEQVKKQPFEIIKVTDNGNTDAPLLKGAGFKAWLVSSLSKKADGSYDFDSAEPVVLTADGGKEMFTDSIGYACSIPLPYGKYIVKETTTPHNHVAVDPFYVTITEHKPETPQTWRILLDNEFEAKLKIIKKDDESKRSVLLPRTEFKIYDMDHDKYVEQITTYPVVKKHKSYFTDSQGYLILPNNLKIGRYRIEEVTAPYGYTLNTDYVEISVDTNTAYQIDPESGATIIEVDYENHPVKGKLNAYKKGEVVSSFDGNDFHYEEQYLQGAEFEVYAAEDIYTADYHKDDAGNRLLEYAEGDYVTTITTGEDGLAVAEELPLGKYLVKEKNAPEGFVLNAVSEEAEFEYVDQNTAVIEESVTFTNDRQKVSIKVTKQDAENESVVAGAVFGIYNAEDILDASGNVIVEADNLLQEMTSDEDGIAEFTLDLPLGQYYVKELEAPLGYVSSDEVLTFDASYQGQDIPVVELQEIKKNEPTTFEFTKSDLTTGVELDGANLTVFDKDGNVIDEWVSVKDEPHVIKRLVVGETYTLREEFAPYGYLKATDVEFTVEDTAEVQRVEMKDEVPTALLIINKKGEFLDKVSLKDNAKGTVEHIFEYITGSLTEVTFEIYAAEDIKAADVVSEDYYKKDQLIGSITTNDQGIAQMGDLPVGKYYVKETETVHGYVLDGEPRYVDLSYRDQDTPVVTYDEDWQNNRQKVLVNVLKKEKGVERTLEGGIFGLFAAEDIVSARGEVLIEKDEIIELKATDEKGEIHFIADLPMDFKYYVQEMYAPDGFVTEAERQEFTFEYGDATEMYVSYSFIFENEPTTVEITKADLATSKELPGAHLKLTDKDGNVVEEWISTEEAHVIKELVVGKKYTLTETKPADGYVTAESITFTIENTAEVQKHQMLDDVTKVKISKTDITGDQEIPGAKLTILDKNDRVVESWISGKEPHYVEKLPIGTYTLREEQAPKGYVLTSDAKFEVKDTGEIQKVSMKNDTAKGKIILNKTAAENGEPLKGVEFEIRDNKGKVLETLKTDAAGHAESKLYEIATYNDGVYGKAIKYYLVETKTTEGYKLDSKKYAITFDYVDQNTPVIEVTKNLKNKKAGGSDSSSGAITGRTAPKTGDSNHIGFYLGMMLGSAIALAGILCGRRKKRKK